MKRYAFAFALFVAACGGRQHGPTLRASDYPGELVSSEQITTNVLMRQQITARFGERETTFDAVVQVQGGVVTVVGLTPFGTRAFSIVQRGRAIEFESFTDEPLPFPPEFILLDVHRTFFVTPAGEAPSDGERRSERGGEEVVESYSEGRLVRRSFRRLDGRPAGLITVTYEGGFAMPNAPATVHFENAWFGYSLVIRTVESTAL